MYSVADRDLSVCIGFSTFLITRFWVWKKKKNPFLTIVGREDHHGSHSNHPEL